MSITVEATSLEQLLQWPTDEEPRIHTLLALRRWWMTDLYQQIRREYSAALDGGDEPSTFGDAKPVVEALPSFRTFIWVDKYIQDSLWRHVGRIVDSKVQMLDEVLAERDVDLGTIEIDPNVEYPGYYENFDYHRQAGGIWRDRRGAAIYAMGARVIHVGRNDALEMHHKFGADIPVESPRRILDIGCGFGKTTLALADRWPDAEIVGLDLAGPCLELGRRMATERGRPIDWKQGNAEELPDDEASFDLVTATMVYHEMPAPAIRRAMAEAHRVLRPGGTLAALENRLIGDPLRDVLGAWHSDVIEEPFANPFRAESFGAFATGAGFAATVESWYPPGVEPGSELHRDRYSTPWSLLVATKPER